LQVNVYGFIDKIKYGAMFTTLYDTLDLHRDVVLMITIEFIDQPVRT